MMKRSILSFQRHIRLALFGFLALSPAGHYAFAFDSVDQLAARLASEARYAASATYAVTLPSAPDDVVYDILLQSMATPSDHLSPCSYLIEWTLPRPDGDISRGFSAYDAGSHMRFRDQRLQEYHYDWDSIPMTGRGVQRCAQFVDLLPQYLADRISHVMADTLRYSAKFSPDTIVGGRHLAMIQASEWAKGYEVASMTWSFDALSGLPVAYSQESNPGGIAEQSLSVEYRAPADHTVTDFSETTLLARYPDVFEKYRSNNFRAESLPGTLLPAFALPTLTGERYSRERTEHFNSPVIVAFVDYDTDFASPTVADVRATLRCLPRQVDVLWVFNGSNIDAAEAVTGQEARLGETTLLSGRGFARDCGIASWPTLLFVGRDASIQDVQVGYNKLLPEIVMQKTIGLD